MDELTTGLDSQTRLLIWDGIEKLRVNDNLMITLFILGMLLFTVNIIAFSIKAAWGITKAIVFVIGLPLILLVLLIIGLAYFAIPLLIIAIIVSFIVLRENGR